MVASCIWVLKQLLVKVCEGEQLAVYMEMLADQLKVNDDFVAEAVLAVVAFTNSELWQRALRAKTRLHEVRLLFKKSSEEIADDAVSDPEVAVSIRRRDVVRHCVYCLCRRCHRLLV